jgi:hypothetical protein
MSDDLQARIDRLQAAHRRRAARIEALVYLTNLVTAAETVDHIAAETHGHYHCDHGHVHEVTAEEMMAKIDEDRAERP